MNVSRDFASVNSNSFDSSALEVDSRLIYVKTRQPREYEVIQ